MKRNLKSLLILICFGILAACAGLRRGPSSIKNADSLFNLVNSEDILKSGYKFELVSLLDLNEKKLIFKNYDISDNEAKKAVEVWQADLNSYLSLYKDDTQVRVAAREVQVKVRDLKRLQQALILVNKSGENSEKVLRKQVELITAFNQNFKIPDAFNFDASSIPLEFAAESKISRAFTDSSFWQSVPDRKKELRTFELTNEELAELSCRADSSDAANFVKLNCANFQFKLFPQISPKVAALNSILYRRLGYNPAPVGFATEVQISYDRTVIPVLKKYKVQFKAVLKTGDVLPFEQLIPKLLPYCKSRNESCFSTSAMFDSNIEAQIEKIILTDVSLQADNGDHTFGSWSYEELDHRFRPEVKALIFVAALTGNTDLRKESNAVVWSGKNFSVSHRIENLNSGLGAVRPGLPMNLNNAKWEVLKKKIQRGSNVYVFDGFRPSLKRQAFSEVSIEDAKWAIRQIAGISEQELTEALAISGFSAAELILAREKLLSVQKNMIETLGLQNEFSNLAQRKIEKNINYRLTGQPALFEISANKKIQVPELNDELINGILKKGQPSLFENKRKISNTVDE